MHTPNLPLGCSANHRFSSDPALTYGFKPQGGRIYLIYLCSIRAAEHQSGGLLCWLCSLPIPAFQSISSRVLLPAGPEQPNSAGKSTAGLANSPPNYKRHKGSSFVMAGADAAWPLPTGECQLLAGENSAPGQGRLVAEPHGAQMAGGDGVLQGSGCCLPTGDPPSPPCSLNSHTLTAGGGRMPISSRRDSTLCSQRCS